MQKVYLLLRNNERKGPFTLEELLELQLKPFDLVWLEGRSTGWRYPAEIEALKNYVAETPKTATPLKPEPISPPEQNSNASNIPVPPSKPVAKNVFVSMPAKPKPAYNIEAQEEISKPLPPETFSTIPQYAPGYQESVPTIHKRISNEPVFQPKDQNEDYHGLYLPKKTKKPFLNPKSIALFIVLIVIGAAGYYFLSADKSNASSQNLVSQSVEQPVKGNMENSAEAIVPENNLTAIPPDKKEKLTKRLTEPNHKKTNKGNTIVLPPIDQDIHNEPSATETVDVNNKKNEDVIPSTETAPKEKKKKLGEAIKDIFKPKEKARLEEKNEIVLEDPKPATNRQSTKRNDADQETKTNAEPNIDWASMVDITSNTPDNWMMGVKGLKLTLRNRSTSAIQTASVELFYYNDNNQVLEKKLVYFSNVAAKGKSTVTAPDHKYADHVEFKLVTVTAKEDRFARN